MLRPPQPDEHAESVPPAADAGAAAMPRRSSKLMNRLAVVLVPVALVSVYLAFVHEPRRTGGQSGGSLNMQAIEAEHGEDAMDRTDVYAEPKAEPGNASKPAPPDAPEDQDPKPVAPKTDRPTPERKSLGEPVRGG